MSGFPAPASTASRPIEVDADHPWLGLASFGEATQRFFFGRDTEIAEIYVRVREQALTVLYGQSGLGKTSLLGAGLIPKLRVENCRPVLIRLRYESGDPPLVQQAFNALAAHGLNPSGGNVSGTLWEWLHHMTSRPDALDTAPPALIFDQFEEIFTLGQRAERPDEVRDLFEQLADVVENRPPAALKRRFQNDRRLAREYDQMPSAVRVVLTLREDFLSHLEQWKKLLPSLMRNRMALSLLSGPQALEAVVKPGNLEGCRLIDEAVGARIVCFVAKRDPGTPLVEIGAVPPLLSLVCDELNRLRLRDNLPSITAELVETQSADILQTFYQQCFADQPAALRHYVEDRMITEGGHRSPVVRDDAVVILRRAGVSDPVIALDALVARRLVNPEDRGGLQWLEITHDVLAPLVVKSRDERREREARWEAEWKLAEQRKKNRLRNVIFGVMLLLVVVAGWGFVEASRAAKEAEAATIQALAAQANAENAEIVAVAANEENRKNLHSASMSALANGLKAWQEDWDELPKGHRAETIEGRTKWHETIAFFCQSLELEPTNHSAAQWLYSTLLNRWEEKRDWPNFQLRHEDSVNSASFSADGSRIATASWDRTARIWDAASGRPIGEPLRHEGPVNSVSFSADGSRIVTASWDKTARVWDAASGKPIGEPLRHEGPVYSASFSADGRRIVTASWDNTARIWDAASGRPIGEPRRHAGDVRSASFSADGSRIVTASWDKTARIWNAASGKPIGKPLRHEDQVYSASFSADGSRIVTASWDKTARVWDAASGKPIAELLRHESPVISASFNADGSRIVTASWDKTARIWDAASGRPIGEPLRHEDQVYSASFSADGSMIVTAGRDKTARIWDTASGGPFGEPLRHEDQVNSASFSANGSMIVTASEDKTARIWDAASGKPIGKPLRHVDEVNNAGFSPDGSRIVTASWDKTARIWDVTSGEPIGKPLSHEGPVYGASFSADGSKIVTASWDKTARIWDAASDKPIGEPLRHDDQVYCASFSADGSRIATASWDKTARIWDAVSGKPVGEPLRHEDQVNSANFSPDGSRIVTASWDKTARIWDAASGKPICEPLRHAGDVRSASFSADGSKIVTASWDKTARIWDAASGRPFGEPLRHEGWVTSARFNAAGTEIITACSDQTARIWQFPEDERGQKINNITSGVIAWARAIAGLTFGEDGELEIIPYEKRMETLRAPGLPDGPWADLAKWMNTPREQRTLSPQSTHTIQEIAEREREFGSIESLRSALRYDPTLPLTRLLLANALEEKNEAKEPGARDLSVPQQAAFLRHYDLDLLSKAEGRMNKGEAAALWARAAEILLQKPEVKVGIGVKTTLAKDEALKAAERALALDPQNANALSQKVKARAAPKH
ncbi:MAG TPA: hypothetical protein VIT91_01630 [Chthoniobacterales bacterium]